MAPLPVWKVTVLSGQTHVPPTSCASGGQSVAGGETQVTSPFARRWVFMLAGHRHRPDTSRARPLHVCVCVAAQDTVAPLRTGWLPTGQTQMLPRSCAEPTQVSAVDATHDAMPIPL